MVVTPVSPDTPVLVTERLELWLPTRADMATMYEIISDPDTARYLGVREGMADHFQRFGRNAGSWFLYGYGSMILRLRSTGEVVGNCGVFHSYRGLGADYDDWPEAGWIVRKDHTGRGLATEAMAAALDWFEREHGPQRIVCMIDPANQPSLALADRLGFAAIRETQSHDGGTVRLFARGPR